MEATDAEREKRPRGTITASTPALVQVFDRNHRFTARGMGGALRVRNVEDEGSTFALTLPRATATDS